VSAGRILVVDDDPQIRRVMRTTLIASGYEVTTARSGEEALEHVNAERYDLVLLDFNLGPGALNGLETCRAIREARPGPELAVITLTVRDAERDKVAALDAGADDYVTKPYSVPELLARIRAALRRTPLGSASGPRRLSLGAVEIDFDTRQVTIRGRQIHLTPKELDLLSYLAAHLNKTLSHRELLQAVWGPDYGGEQEYLRVFVNRLRKKIESDPSRPRYLLTQPWVGYRLQLAN
jgi:two-component system, OmpR family, KDP operon response regulator KdpE